MVANMDPFSQLILKNIAKSTELAEKDLMWTFPLKAVPQFLETFGRPQSGRGDFEDTTANNQGTHSTIETATPFPWKRLSALLGIISRTNSLRQPESFSVRTSLSELIQSVSQEKWPEFLVDTINRLARDFENATYAQKTSLVQCLPSLTKRDVDLQQKLAFAFLKQAAQEKYPLETVIMLPDPLVLKAAIDFVSRAPLLSITAATDYEELTSGVMLLDFVLRRVEGMQPLAGDIEAVVDKLQSMNRRILEGKSRSMSRTVVSTK
ncbi:hypothetical protein H4219_003753 [Mycoemilia scoparia]|uniref:Uncharacterized protein n=1 Tax=Mycoemilia scoparia TaxID=417184 RepID=A0A9W8DS74_9FUNG|nr:hypothetical protein H4219_003753 [Mycoemilia scoparia]